jgi:hypothetical protein
MWGLLQKNNVFANQQRAFSVCPNAKKRISKGTSQYNFYCKKQNPRQNLHESLCTQNNPTTTKKKS